MGVVKRTLSKAIRNWEARRLMTAHNAGVSRKKTIRTRMATSIDN